MLYIILYILYILQIYIYTCFYLYTYIYIYIYLYIYKYIYIYIYIYHFRILFFCTPQADFNWFFLFVKFGVPPTTHTLILMTAINNNIDNKLYLCNKLLDRFLFFWGWVVQVSTIIKQGIRYRIFAKTLKLKSFQCVWMWKTSIMLTSIVSTLYFKD